MADHPLRPATDHCLGRPLPHQQANPTRAPPIAINLSPVARAHAVLAEVSLGYPPQQGRFPRATHPCATPHRCRSPDEAFDLHVLSMPPAFVLSQDQTLMFIPGESPMSPHETHRIRPTRLRIGRFSRAAKRSNLRSANVQRHLRRRPRIPSIPNNVNQQSPVPGGTSGLTANSG